MSMYAVLPTATEGEYNQHPLASNSGWGSFGRWVDGLPLEPYEALIELWEHGLSERTTEIYVQLQKARDASEPPHYVRDIVDRLVVILSEKPQFIIISNGMGNGSVGTGEDEDATEIP